MPRIEQHFRPKEHYEGSREFLRDIPVIFPEKFPNGYKNDVAHWGNFSPEELHQTNQDGTQKLLHMDIDFGNVCSLNCPHCFRRDDRFDKTTVEQKFLTEEEVLKYIEEAKTLGLQSVKFLGRGDPFENPAFLGFLRKLKKMEINSAIFTKGHVIGSDKLSSKYNAVYGINSGQELVEELDRLDVSLLLGFNSFDKKTQDEYVGVEKSPIKNYVELRDNALKLLVNAGFNKYVDGKPTKLAMIAAPIKPENLDDILEIYKWGRRRNIYVLSCPSTMSGKGEDESARVQHFEDYIPKLIDLYTTIYKWNIENNLMTLEQFKNEGVSLYPGCHPCTQTAAGMYMTLSGKVVRCPGRADVKSTFSQDLRKEGGLKEVWVGSENYQRAAGKIKSPEGNHNYHCPARDWVGDSGTRSIPPEFYKKVKSKVLEHFKND